MGFLRVPGELFMTILRDFPGFFKKVRGFWSYPCTAFMFESGMEKLLGTEEMLNLEGIMTNPGVISAKEM